MQTLLLNIVDWNLFNKGIEAIYRHNKESVSFES